MKKKIETIDDVVTYIKKIVDDLIKKNNLDDVNLKFYLKTDVKESFLYAIVLFEQNYPKQYNSNKTLKGVTSSVLQVKLEKTGTYKDTVQVRIKNDALYKAIDVPNSVITITQNGVDGKSLRFYYYDGNLFKYIENHIQYAISNYSSAGDMFGCCSRFQKCSDERKCVHENKLYATKCMYKIHLDGGRIFYGKNKNV